MGGKVALSILNRAGVRTGNAAQPQAREKFISIRKEGRPQDKERKVDLYTPSQVGLVQ